MTVTTRVLDSFKLPDFDVDYFVEEAVKSNEKIDLISNQLDEFITQIDADMNSVVRQASEIILTAAHVSDTIIGELLSAREHIAILKSGIESVTREESKRFEAMKHKHQLLQRALAISQLLKRASRFTLDVAKLRAQVGNSQNGSASGTLLDRSVVESVSGQDDLESIASIDVLKDEVTWTRSLIKSLTNCPKTIAVDEMAIFSFSAMTRNNLKSTSAKEDLLKEQEKLLADILSKFSSTEEDDSAQGSESQHIGMASVNQSEIYKFYHKKLSEQKKIPAEFDDWRWLDGVKEVIEEIEDALSGVAHQIDSVEEERKTMLAELSGLDGKAKRQLSEQAVLEKEVSELELQVNSIKVVREVDALVNNKDILISNFSKFEGIVDSLELVSRDVRRFDQLKSKVCSVVISVGTAAIEVYTKRMLQYMADQQGLATVPSMSLFGKFSEALTVVKRVAGLFRKKEDREYNKAVAELEKAFVSSREKILTPILSEYISTLLKSESLPNSIRRTVYFAESFGRQESSFFSTIFASSDESLLSLFRALGVALYYGLRTGVISCENLADLRESAEVVRLEVLSSSASFPFILNVAFKLHRDIQERLIFRIEAFIRDSIRRYNDWTSIQDIANSTPPPVERTFACLELITGALDSQTFYEIANESVRACLDVLVEAPLSIFQSEEDRLLFLIAQLLALRERVTSIECEMVSLVKHSAPNAERRGITDQFKRLLATPSSRDETAVRSRIESDLKSVCEQFNARVVARIISHPGHLDEIKSRIKVFLKSESLEKVLLRPILVELEEAGSYL